LKRPRVLKFGGATLGREERVGKALKMVRETPAPLIVVVSAREGITDRLKECSVHCRNRAQRTRLLDDLTNLHKGIPTILDSNLRTLDQELDELASQGQESLALVDSILARGERLSAHWFARRLATAGTQAKAIEADDLGLVTDGNHGMATVDMQASARGVTRGLEAMLKRGEVPVFTGFIGRSGDGSVTTLGRGGSDYSATSVGGLMHAHSVTLVKTEASLFTADPKIVPDAAPICHLTYEEAEELAQFGARVLHPLTVEPAREHGIAVTVTSLDAPHLSTTIGPARVQGGVRAMTMLSPVALVYFRVPGGRQKRGVISRVSEMLSAQGINVVTMFTSAAVLCILVESHMGSRARNALKPLVAASGFGATLEGPEHIALVTAIGEGIVADIGRVPPQVLGLARGMSGTTRTLSIAVPEERGREVLRAMHTEMVTKATSRSDRRGRSLHPEGA